MFVCTDVKVIEVADASELYAALRFAKGMIFLCKTVDTSRDSNVFCYSLPRIMIQNFELGYYMTYQHCLDGVMHKYKAVGDKDNPNCFTINKVDAEGLRFPKSLLVPEEKMMKCAVDFMELMKATDFGADIVLPGSVEWICKNKAKDDRT